MTLYLLPNLLHPDADFKMSAVIGLTEIVNQLDGFFVETPKEARKFLKHFDFAKLREKPMEIVDKRTEHFTELLAPLKDRGESWGMISDAGLPSIADPGANLTLAAKQAGIKVKAIPGPSSIYLGLMQSGLPAQRFTFYGYVPRQINSGFFEKGFTHIFIQTPYKNVQTMQNFCEILSRDTLLTIACDLTLPEEEVTTKSIREWRKEDSFERFHKRPAVFFIFIS